MSNRTSDYASGKPSNIAGGISRRVQGNEDFASAKKGSAFDPDATAFMTATGIPNDSTVFYGGTAQERTGAQMWAAINTLVVSLKASGVWVKRDFIYPVIGGTTARHKLNLKNPADTDGAYRLTIPVEWTHGATGMTSATRGADTHLIPSLHLSNYSVNLTYQSRTLGAGDSFDFRALKSGRGVPAHQIIGRFSVTNILADAFSGGGSDRIIEAIGSPVGIFSNNVLTSASHKVFKDGVQLGATRTATLNLTDIDQSYSFGAQDLSSGVTGREYSFSAGGDGMTDVEIMAEYTAVAAYQSSLGRS